MARQRDNRTLKDVPTEALWLLPAIFTVGNTGLRQVPYVSVVAWTLGVGVSIQAVGLFSFALP